MPLRGGSGFSVAARKKEKQRGVGAHFEWALRHSHARHTAPYHPQPTGGLCQGPCGSGGHCRGRGLPQGHHNGPEEATAGPRHTSSALPRPRPVGHQSAPWPHQTPTKHPREVQTCPLGLGRPLSPLSPQVSSADVALSLPNPLSDRCPIAVSDLEIAVTDFGDRQNGGFSALLFTALATFPALQTAILSSGRGYFWSFLSDLGFQKHADRRFHPKSPPTSSPKSPKKAHL